MSTATLSTLDEKLGKLHDDTAGAPAAEYLAMLREGLPESKFKRLRDVMTAMNLTTADVRRDLRALKSREEFEDAYRGDAITAAREKANAARAKVDQLAADVSAAYGEFYVYTPHARYQKSLETPTSQGPFKILADAETERADAQAEHSRLLNLQRKSGQKLAMLKQVAPRVFADGFEPPPLERPFVRPLNADAAYIAKGVAAGSEMIGFDGRFYRPGHPVPDQLDFDLMVIDAVG